MKLDFLKEYEFFAGVPDSLLSPLCNYLIKKYGISRNHIIAANEGNAVALAAGYHLATGKVPVVYLQNSGIGNIINPVVSLMNDKVYGIPCLFIIGWRGEPGVYDEPQHAFQGEITLKLLEDIGIRTFIIEKEAKKLELSAMLKELRLLLEMGRQVALVVCKEALEFETTIEFRNDYTMSREEIIKHIIKVCGEDIIVSTTGKASRELFEIREANKQSHKYDFLTVGSMGHSSSIALAIALQKPDKKIWCIDGDGAALMHMGAMAVIGANSPGNLVHIVINNEAYESVGGMPTAANKIDLYKIAHGCGYPSAVCVDNLVDLDDQIELVKSKNELSFIEAKSRISSRRELGRPFITPKENKIIFMNNLLKA